MNRQSEIANFFANKNVLITGGTGFVGKLLVQKLIRSCPELKGIYLISRQRNNKSASERWNEILNNEVFDKARKADPNFIKKIHIIPGDMKYAGLALSVEDRNLLINNINIVMHCAAIVIFKSALKNSIDNNINGTKELLNLCEEIKNLDVAMYMSTVYSHSERYNLGEYFMSPPIKPDTILKLKDDIDEFQLNSLEKNLLNGEIFRYENVYVYTKAISEEIVREKSKTLPIGLFRPSIIIPTYKDPIASWTDSFYGIFGLMTLTMLGILRVYCADKSVKLQCVPADYCVNAYIATTYDVYKKNKQDNHTQDVVYNLTSGDNSTGLMESVDNVLNNTIPSSKAIWITTVKFVSCIYYYWFLSFFYHFLPALFVDTYRLFLLKKPKLLKLFYKLEKLRITLYFFSSKNWNIAITNTLKVYRNLNSVDQKMFPFDISTLDWNDYYNNCGYGIRKYVIKDNMDEENIQKSKERYERLQFYHKILLFTIYSIGSLLLWNIFKPLLVKHI